jgi:hypothetical protein
VRAGIDLLVRNDHLELLLCKRSSAAPFGDIGERLCFSAAMLSMQY